MGAYRWVTFDCYGTLIDWDTGIREFLQGLLARKERRVDLDRLHRRWEDIQFTLLQETYRPYKEILRQSLEATLKEFGLPYSPEDGEAFVASMPKWPPFPDVPETLRELRGTVRIAIISNTDNDILKESVRLMGTEFDALITAEDARVYKPDPAIFRFALERLGDPPDRVLHVAFGSRYDLIPAKSVGIRVCWLNRGGCPLPEGVIADAIVTGMREVLNLVLKR